MIIVVLFFLVGWAAAAYFMWVDDLGRVIPILMGALFGAFAGGIGSLAAMGLYEVGNEPYPRQVTEVRQVVSLRDETTINGSFALGSGSIDSTPMFFYYYESAPDTYVKSWVKASETTIVEDASLETARLDTEANLLPPFYWGWTIPTGSKDPHYYFHVPKGTVIKELKVQ